MLVPRRLSSSMCLYAKSEDIRKFRLYTSSEFCIVTNIKQVNLVRELEKKFSGKTVVFLGQV